MKEEREAATQRAREFLTERAFKKAGDGAFVGRIGDSTAERWAELRVVFPADFPDCLPRVEVLARSDSRVRAHLERSGKLCLAQESSALIDSSRPEAVVRDALQLAADILFERSEEQQQKDIQDEFLSYWPDEGAQDVLSVLAPRQTSGEVVSIELIGRLSKSLVAPDREAAESWAEKTGCRLGKQRRGYLVRLVTLFSPPAFGERVTLRSLLGLVAAHAEADVQSAVEQWLKAHGPPSLLMFSAPLGEAHDVVFAAEVPKLGGTAERMAQRGFRPQTVPNWRRHAVALDEPVNRWDVSRVDAGFLLERGGADLTLHERSVAVVGCGSVGSHAASLLAESGFGRLVLVDQESLDGGNVHRHVLGASLIGHSKAKALSSVLSSRFPHTEFEAAHEKIQTVLLESPGLVCDCDLVVIALGDETLERVLDRYFAANRPNAPRLHAWLEPLGLGGHVLSIGVGRGCFSCLFRRDEEHGLLNMASLAAPGQEFSRTLGGCAGTFTPFGAIDAHQAAVETTRQALRAMAGPSPRLVTWSASDERHFLSGGFTLSRRGEELRETHRAEETCFYQSDCDVCRAD